MKRFILSLGSALMLGAAILSISTDPSPAAAAQEPVVSYRGSHAGSERLVLGPFNLHAGLTIVRARHGGTDVFAVDLVSPTPGADLAAADFRDYHPLIVSIGRFDGAAAAVTALDGPYFLLVGAGGAYELRVEQPLPATVTPVNQREFTGIHQQVTPVVALPAGPVRVTARCSGEFQCGVWLFVIDNLGGGLISGTATLGRLIDGYTGPYEETVTIDLPVAGLYVFQVYAAPENARWTLRIE